MDFITFYKYFSDFQPLMFVDLIFTDVNYLTD